MARREKKHGRRKGTVQPWRKDLDLDAPENQHYETGRELRVATRAICIPLVEEAFAQEWTAELEQSLIDRWVRPATPRWRVALDDLVRVAAEIQDLVRAGRWPMSEDLIVLDLGRRRRGKPTSLYLRPPDDELIPVEGIDAHGNVVEERRLLPAKSLAGHEPERRPDPSAMRQRLLVDVVNGGLLCRCHKVFRNLCDPWDKESAEIFASRAEDRRDGEPPLFRCLVDSDPPTLLDDGTQLRCVRRSSDLNLAHLSLLLQDAEEYESRITREYTTPAAAIERETATIRSARPTFTGVKRSAGGRPRRNQGSNRK